MVIKWLRIISWDFTIRYPEADNVFLGIDTTLACMKQAYGLGINFFDTAERYYSTSHSRVN